VLRESYRNGQGEVFGNTPLNEKSAEAIPFQLDGGFLILVDGRIGRLSPLKFVLDTGATHTVIDTKIAKRLLLPRQEGEGKVVNFDREVEIAWTILPELQLGPLYARDIRVMVGDLRQFSEFAEGVDAIIGLDVLRSTQSIKIDYLSNLVTFKLADCRLVDSRIPVALTVQVRTQGQLVRLIVDTGLQDLLLYQDRIRNHLPQLKLRGSLEAYAGRLRGQAATLSGIELGTDVRQSLVLLLKGAPSSLPADIDGYLGLNTLHARMIELDFASNKLRWQ
jgi:predicted aspartyl protease